MTFRCEDLRERGLIFIPNTAPEYDPLLEDIQRRIEDPPPGAIDPDKRCSSAILLNQAGMTVVSFVVAWRYEQEDGQLITGRRTCNDVIGQRPSNSMDYWNHILDGSKRYIGEDGKAGDNSDVRPPAPEEVPKSGGAGSGGGTGRSSLGVISVTLALTGAFFSAGEFAGFESSTLWRRTSARVAAWREVGDLLRDGLGFDRVEAFTGAAGTRPPPPRDVTGHARWNCAGAVARHRELFGDEAASERLISYIENDLPALRRL